MIPLVSIPNMFLPCFWALTDSALKIRLLLTACSVISAFCIVLLKFLPDSVPQSSQSYFLGICLVALHFWNQNSVLVFCCYFLIWRIKWKTITSSISCLLQVFSSLRLWIHGHFFKVIKRREIVSAESPDVVDSRQDTLVVFSLNTWAELKWLFHTTTVWIDLLCCNSNWNNISKFNFCF